MESSRENPSNFTRKRKLPFVDMVLFILSGINKSLTVQLTDFFSSLGKSDQTVTKQAFSKSRMQLRYESLIELNDTLVQEYYSMEHELYKGYRLLAVDGSMVELPHGEEIRKTFGSINHSPKGTNCGWSICFYDVLNEIIVESKLHKYGNSERKLLTDDARRFKASGKQRKDIIIADRGFPSIDVVYELVRNGYDFVIRYNGGAFLKESRFFNESPQTDVELTLDLREIRRRINWARYAFIDKMCPNKVVTVRLVKIELGGGKTEFLMTTLLDKQLFTPEDLKTIYGLRWRGEEAFKLQKCTAELENISGRSERTIYQDYYAKILMMNMHSIIVQDAEAELNKDIADGKKKLKYENYKVNRNVSFGIIRPKLQDLIRPETEGWSQAYDNLVREVKKYIIPVKPNRSYPRVVKTQQKFPSNKRRAT